MRRDGKIIAFVSCKGGSGATFLAANLAYALAQENQRVALFDLNLQFGDAALFVSDQKPAATLSHVAQQIHRLDASFLAASMVQGDAEFQHPGRARRSRPMPATSSPSTSTSCCTWRATSMISSCWTWAAASMPSACARWTMPT